MKYAKIKFPVIPDLLPIAKKEFYIFIAYLLFFGTIAIQINTPEIHHDNYHFGGEYGNIAASIVSGKGYSNPFSTDSGPTSWMPPVYTYLIAAIFFLFGIKTSLSAAMLLCLQYTAMSFIPVLLFRICRRHGKGIFPHIIHPIYISLVVYSFTSFFKIVHDTWLIMLLITLLIYAYSNAIHKSPLKTLTYGWSILGGLVLLSSPTLGLVFIILTFLPFTQTTVKKKFILLTISAMLCSPWIIRNYRVFNKFIFIKSNLFYDIYQANYLDDDGILDLGTFEKYHPYKNISARNAYTLMGEKKYMDNFKQSFFEKAEKNPEIYLYKTINRLLYMFIIHPAFSPEKKSYKTFMDLLYFTKDAIYCLPFFFSLFFIIKFKQFEDSDIYIAIIVFFVFMMPYVMVGFYRRYRIPLLPVFSILYFHFTLYSFDYIKNAFPKKTHHEKK